MNVLSLFDGMSCGQIALNRAGIKVSNYFASEIDKYAIQVTKHNYPNTQHIGDVTKVKIKLFCLSEVYSYICNYDSNLQSNISEWEVLYWLNKDFTLSAKIRTQKPNERQEVSEPSTVQRIEEVWFSKREMGSVRKFGDYTTSRRDGEENDIRTPQQLQCGKWGYDNDIYRRYKKENIGIASRETKNGDSEKKNFRNIEEAIFKGRESEGCFRENKKSNVEEGCSGKLFERKKEDRLSREVEKEKGNRRTKEGNFINEVIRELCRWDETDGITQDYWCLLRLHKEEQVTVVEYEKGFYIFKGRIDLCIGGSPCQSFSFAGKRNGMTTTCNEEIHTLEKYLELKNGGFKFEGESYLFWEYMRILTDIRKYNPNVLFLLENVEMGNKWERVLSEAIGIYGVHINSALVSAQNRKRIYWTNIRTREDGLFSELHSDIPQPEDRGILLKDILETEVDEKYYLSNTALTRLSNIGGEGFKSTIKTGEDKSSTILSTQHKLPRGMDLICAAMRGHGENNEQRLKPQPSGRTNALTSVQKDNLVISGCDFRRDEGLRFRDNGKSGTLQARARNDESCGQLASVGSRIRRLTPVECERLQTVKDNYTSCVSDSQRYRMLGNGWTVDVIAHIFSFMNNT